MSFLDIFTGDSAKKAAEQNKALLQQNQLAGTGVLNSNLTSGTGILQNNQTAGTGVLQSNLANGTNVLQNNQDMGLAALRENQAAGTSALNQGQAGALSSLDAARGAYSPLASKYGTATSLGLDSLGANGPEGNARATAAFEAGPGYRWGVDQALEGINRKANANGGLIGGNTLAALSDRAGQMGRQEYGSWQDRLNGYVNPEMAATAGMAGADAAKAGVYRGTGQDIAGLGTSTAGGIVGLGTNTANSIAGLGTTTAGNIANLGTTTAGGLAGLGTHTADSIANLGTNTTNGVTNQNTQAANAELQGSKNLWGLGMGLAQLGVGAATGGTSLLGGLGSIGTLKGYGNP